MKTIEWTRTGGHTHRVMITEIGVGSGYVLTKDAIFWNGVKVLDCSHWGFGELKQ